jgi:hypothetical protein
MRNLWRVHCVFQMEPSTSDSLLVRPLRVPRPRPFFPVRAGFLVCANDEPQRHSLMEKDYLVLKRASASRPSGEWNDDDYDVLADGAVVGRIFKANAGVRLPRGPHADTWLCRDARGRDGRIRKELAAGRWRIASRVVRLGTQPTTNPVNGLRRHGRPRRSVIFVLRPNACCRVAGGYCFPGGRQKSLS